ncbi:calcineurin-like phosphoesterase family protein [Maricaulis sp.]|uniref:calcineurin-like phosphoesterase family protein n=1 Tax=Maricaulis sp. TaxID=1486257 RepID=UPI002633061D|nr:calcineurin-like phosphoesterase family protein [Maricaulis sp.]
MIHSVLRFGGVFTVSLCLAGQAQAQEEAYLADIEVIPAEPGAQVRETVTGRVFNDRNRDGVHQRRERGVAGVMVSNGREVVTTDRQGRYELPVRDDMSVFVIQPSGWRVPTDENWVPQFAYEHKPDGSPKPLRFGGLPPTGPLPAAINFPLIESAVDEEFTCAILGDVQTYANTEVGFMRDSSVDDIIDRGPGAVDCLLAVGDVMGDDLGLIPRVAEIWGAVGVPQWWAHGNHDYDFDADFDADSADSWRNLYGPAYYAFQMGEVTFILLDNVVYPCTGIDAQTAGREFCLDEERKRYNGRITDDQMAFVAGVLSHADEDDTFVFAHHIPFVSFVDQTATAHQTDNVTDLYTLIGDREAISLSGHTHAIENLTEGDHFEGWTEAVGVDSLPFRHIIAGAVSGAWFSGDLDVHGTPMSLSRLGAPRGWVELAFDGEGEYSERYIASNMGRDRAMWLSVNTPGFRHWYETINAWRAEDRETRDPVPPLNFYDLPDVKLLTPDDLAGGSFITANVWIGDSDTQVSLVINDAPAEAMVRTQEAEGEAARIGADYADPFAIQRQFTVARHAFESRSGNPNAQGVTPYARYASTLGPAQPQRSIADRNMHLWRYRLPETLPEGVHVATVTATDRHGETRVDRMIFEVRAERPDPNWRADVWDAFDNGAPVRD